MGMPAAQPDRLVVLLSLVDDPDPGVRESVAQHLGWWNFPSEQRLQPLLHLLEDRDAGVRAAATAALGRVPIADLQPASAALVRNLDDADPVCRMNAVHLLWRLGEKSGHDVVLVAGPLLHDPDATRRQLAAEMVGRLGKEGSDALADLERCAARDPEISVRLECIATLGKMGPPAVPVLARLLGDSNTFCRAEAARLLGELGRDAEPAVPALQAVLNDHADNVRVNAALALHRIDPQRFAPPPRAAD
jgi:HEAT repeat protein